MSNLSSPIAMSPTHSPSIDFPSAPPPTPLCDPLAASPTRMRNGSAPSASGQAGQSSQQQRLSGISVQISRLAASMDGEGSEEEKEASSPLSSTSSNGYGSSGGQGSGSASSPFTSFSARLAAARRKSPIPRLEIKINNDDEQQQQQQLPGSNQQAANGKPMEESKANDSQQQQQQPLTRSDSGISISTPFGAKTPQNSPAAPMTPSGVDALNYQLPSGAFNSSFNSSSAFVPTTPSSAAGGRRGWTQLASYQPITPAGSPAAPMTPLPQSSGGGASFASSPIPITPTPLMQRESDPPPTPNSAAITSPYRSHMQQQQPQQQVSPSPYSSHLPPTKTMQRAVSVGAVQPSQSPVRRAYMQDAVPNTPLDLLEPATPVCSPNPLYAMSDKSFTVGLASIPPSPSVFLGTSGAGSVGQRRGYKEPAGVPNTPASPGWQLPSPSGGNGSTLTFASHSPGSPTTLAAIHEVDTPQDHTPNPFTPPKPTQPTASTAASSAGAMDSMSNALLTPAIAYFLTLVRTLHRSGRLSDSQRELLKDQLLSTAAPFLAVFALTMDSGIAGKQADIEAAMVAMTAGSSAPQQLALAYQPYAFDTLLPITADNHAALLRGIHTLGLHRLNLTDLWGAFESESGFDELTQPAFLSCITSLLASSSASAASSTPLKHRISHFLTLYSALRTSRNNQPAYVSWSYLFTALAVLCQASMDEKLTLVFQLLDGDGNNSVRTEQCREWLDCVLLLVCQLVAIGGGSGASGRQRDGELVAGVARKEVKRMSEAMWQRSSGGLKGKVNLSRFLQWDANAVRVVHQLCDSVYF